MSRDALLARAQAAAERGMVDTCTVRRVIGEVTERGTGVVTRTHLDPNPYAGPCRVQQHQATADRQDAGEDQVLMLRLELQLPISVTGLQVADEVTITASRDPDLVGRVFLIHDLAHKTDASSRRVQCVERTGS